MMTPQTAAMLQNNAGDPRMVSRIAQEQGVSQDEIAQALKIPAESAARYMPTDISAPQEQSIAAQAPAQSLGAPAVSAAMPMTMAAQMPIGGGQAQGGLSGTAGGSGAGPAGLGTATIAEQSMKPAASPPPTQGPQTKPMPMPAPGKPMAPQMGKPMMEKPAQPAGFRQPMGGAGLRQPMGRPNFAGAQRGGNAGEQAFVNAFNRMRGNAR